MSRRKPNQAQLGLASPVTCQNPRFPVCGEPQQLIDDNKPGEIATLTSTITCLPHILWFWGGDKGSDDEKRVYSLPTTRHHPCSS
jgi:hypothetical protein